MNADNPFAEKSVIITGGSSGIGRELCLNLARKGANIIIGNRSDQSGQRIIREIRELGGIAHFLKTDVASPQDCRDLVAFSLENFGRLDLAFNNAGLQRQFNAIEHTPIEDFSDIVDVNLKGTLYMMKYEVEAMLATGGGSIVNNASIFGLKAMPEAAYYTASKHGIVGATKAAALDCARKNIRINAVCPGPTKTPSFDRVTGGDADLYNDAVPMHRVAMPSEVTETVEWLLSPQASYITGACLPIDGGMSAQ